MRAALVAGARGSGLGRRLAWVGFSQGQRGAPGIDSGFVESREYGAAAGNKELAHFFSRRVLRAVQGGVSGGISVEYFPPAC